MNQNNYSCVGILAAIGTLAFVTLVSCRKQFEDSTVAAAKITKSRGFLPDCPKIFNFKGSAFKTSNVIEGSWSLAPVQEFSVGISEEVFKAVSETSSFSEIVAGKPPTSMEGDPPNTFRHCALYPRTKGSIADSSGIFVASMSYGQGEPWRVDKLGVSEGLSTNLVECFKNKGDYLVRERSIFRTDEFLGSFQKPPSKVNTNKVLPFNDEDTFPVYKPSLNFPHCIYEAKLANLYKNLPLPSNMDGNRKIHIVIHLPFGFFDREEFKKNIGTRSSTPENPSSEKVTSQESVCSEEIKSQALSETAVKLEFGQAKDLSNNSPGKVCTLPANSKLCFTLASGTNLPATFEKRGDNFLVELAEKSDLCSNINAKAKVWIWGPHWKL